MAGLRRNGLMAAAATTTMAIALAVAGAGFLLSVNLAHVASVLESQVEIVGFLHRDLSPAQRQAVLSKVRALPAVQRATIVDRAEALRRLQQSFRSLGSLRGLLPTNPLPDSIEVRVADARQVRALAESLGRLDGVEEVVYGAPVVDRLVSLTRAVRVAGGVLAVLLVGAALLIIVNTIRLTIGARRQEIEIMTLVGATPGFVRAPFVVEGVLQGMAAAAVATAVLVAGYLAIETRASAALPFLPVVPGGTVLPAAVILVWVMGIAVGMGGSVIGLRRYLTV